MKKILLSFLLLFMATISYAQIGYQVSLLNTATGEPRANETVSCNVTLTNSEGGVVYSGTQSANSNDFGVVSLKVGNTTMFENMDWSKLPLFIEVSVDGKLIGKSQILSVPIADYAKKTGVLTYENIGNKKIVCYYSSGHEHQWTFNGKEAILVAESGEEPFVGYVRVDGNSVFGKVSKDNKTSTFLGHYSQEDDTIYIVITNKF